MTRNQIEWLLYILVIILLFIAYASIKPIALKGYGYPGHNGFHRHHSHWYRCRHDYSRYPSTRENSLNGSRFSQRGLSGGK